jgi:hypothetical protein
MAYKNRLRPFWEMIATFLGNDCDLFGMIATFLGNDCDLFGK